MGGRVRSVSVWKKLDCFFKGCLGRVRGWGTKEMVRKAVGGLVRKSLEFASMWLRYMGDWARQTGRSTTQQNNTTQHNTAQLPVCLSLSGRNSLSELGTGPRVARRRPERVLTDSFTERVT